MPHIAIIIPCYNEQKRLRKSEFIEFASLNPNIHLVFVNDGSNDNTVNIIVEMVSLAKNITLINLTKNSGKGEAVRQGILYALKNPNLTYIGYLDADLSTSLDEYFELYNCCYEKNADFIFGARIKKLGSDIKRSFLRHITARALVTFIDKKFELGCYDTQCGAKLFKRAVLETIINQPFVSKWFFDIEIFLRIRSQKQNFSGIEYPLKKWHNVKGSKINILSFPFVCKDIFVLFSKYK